MTFLNKIKDSFSLKEFITFEKVTSITWNEEKENMITKMIVK